MLCPENDTQPINAILIKILGFLMLNLVVGGTVRRQHARQVCRHYPKG
jgi:hypothetical protein